MGPGFDKSPCHSSTTMTRGLNPAASPYIPPQHSRGPSFPSFQPSRPYSSARSEPYSVSSIDAAPSSYAPSSYAPSSYAPSHASTPPSSPDCSPLFRPRDTCSASPPRKQSSPPRGLAKRPSPGDIVFLSRTLHDGSVLKKLKALNIGHPEGHPMVVLELYKDLAICAQVTSFTAAAFSDKCRSNTWAARYVPINHGNHPFGDTWRLHLASGAMRSPSYANIETPVVVEWRHCERPTNMNASLSSESLAELLKLATAYNLAPGPVSDHTAVRDLLAREWPGLHFNTQSSEQRQTAADYFSDHCLPKAITLPPRGRPYAPPRERASNLPGNGPSNTAWTRSSQPARQQAPTPGPRGQHRGPPQQRQGRPRSRENWRDRAPQRQRADLEGSWRPGS